MVTIDVTLDFRKNISGNICRQNDTMSRSFFRAIQEEAVENEARLATN